MANIGFISLGCAKNQVDCERMMYRVQEAGHTVKSDVVGSDVVVINTCGFIDSAKSEAIDYILQTAALKAEGLVGKILVTGCLSQRYQKDILKEMPEVDGILGTGSYTEIVPAIEKLLEGEQVVEFGSIDAPEVETGRIMTTAGHYAFIKIAEGCDNHCSYCVIPYARGRVRSKPLEDIREEISSLEKKGFSEIVLVGINLSAYGTDCGASICDAVELAASFDGIKRVRLGSLEPDHMTPDVTKRLAECKKLCPQFHISLQSGCDKTLKRMNRHYTAAEYEELCTRLRSEFEDATLTTDVMVGFSGETKEDFEISRDFVKKIGFEKVHVFPYSRRAGTRAAEFPDVVENAEKERRSREMIAAAGEVRHEFLERQIGRTVEVLFEEKLRDGSIQGYTANYTPVRIKSGCTHGLRKVKITACGDDWCEGELI